jgi:hypothetical protein
VRLHEHPDFRAFVTAAADEAELLEAFVEKDYWITEILRVIATTLPDRAVLKGGTSLSKGWDLLDRFSEDVDLFVNPSVDPPLTARQIDKVLKQLKQDVEAVAGLSHEPEDSRTIGGFGREDTFRYQPAFTGALGFPPTVRLEPGVQSGEQPTERRPISSIVGKTLVDRGVAGDLGVECVEPFEMKLLHFGRTFVEKLFAIHGKIERLKSEGHPLGRDARHYADLYVLGGRQEVVDMLGGEEYELIRLDYDEKSRAYFPKSYRPPVDLRFGASDALFPDAELRSIIEPVYEEECQRLFFRPHPPFAEVLARFEELRPRL